MTPATEQQAHEFVPHHGFCLDCDQPRSAPIHRLVSDTEAECPDCGCGPAQHNAVNRVPGGLTAHCGSCGSCWKSLNTPFVEIVRKHIETSEARAVPPERIWVVFGEEPVVVYWGTKPRFTTLPLVGYTRTSATEEVAPSEPDDLAALIHKINAHPLMERLSEAMVLIATHPDQEVSESWHVLHRLRKQLRAHLELATSITEGLAEALREIASQKLRSEIEPIDGEIQGDFEYAYDMAITVARTALA